MVGAYLLSGPSEMFATKNYTESLRTLFAGHILKALITPFLFLPVLPEMINSVQFEYLPNQKEHVNKGLANINCFFLYLGMIVGPLLGQSVANLYGFKSVYDTLAAINMTFVSLYFCCVILRETYPHSDCYDRNGEEREGRIIDLEESYTSSDVNICNNCSNDVIRTNEEVNHLLP